MASGVEGTRATLMGKLKISLDEFGVTATPCLRQGL